MIMDIILFIIYDNCFKMKSWFSVTVHAFKSTEQKVSMFFCGLSNILFKLKRDYRHQAMPILDFTIIYRHWKQEHYVTFPFIVVIDIHFL